MGFTYTTVKLSNLSKTGQPIEASFLVDTGALDCMVNGQLLDEAGIQKEGKAVYELANGEVVEYSYGFARISMMGQETVTQVVFGPKDCEPLLGVVALENLGIMVDPVTRSLKRSVARPLK